MGNFRKREHAASEAQKGGNKPKKTAGPKKSGKPKKTARPKKGGKPKKKR